jgi:dihydroorotate dehydrogenase electron transfer subunit
MRRPLSIMRAHSSDGWLEFLYRPHGAGLQKLARRAPGETINLLAPIGRGFAPDPERPMILALGGGVGIPPMIFLAERLKDDARFELLLLAGSEVPFPFELSPAKLAAHVVPEAGAASIALLEEWGVASRLASNAGLPGAFAGHVTELARRWLQNASAETVGRVQMVACGPAPMLRACAALARAFHVPCQVAVEEYMACGVGGCAGCAVLLETPAGPAMKRACVDGPVFDAAEIFPGRAANRS